jgi:hypothetical protein
VGCGLIPFVSQIASPAPADRLALIIEGLCQAVARRLGLAGLAGPFLLLIWTRLRRIKVRFARRILAPLPISSRPQAVPEAMIASAAKQSRIRPHSASHPLPRQRAWLLRLVPETASGASQLRYFLADPEVAALLAAAPKLQGILRPLCHMLGIRAAGIRAASIRPGQALPSSSQRPDPPLAAPGIPGHAPNHSAAVAVPAEATPPPSSRALPL